MVAAIFQNQTLLIASIYILSGSLIVKGSFQNKHKTITHYTQSSWISNVNLYLFALKERFCIIYVNSRE